MIIAEIGINHKGSVARATRMLKTLVGTGVDAVTFQIPKSEFYEKNKQYGGPLERGFYKKAASIAHRRKKAIGFAVSDIGIVPFLDKSGADFWKTLSSEISNDKLQAVLQKTGKPVFISTGFSGEEEIIAAGKKYNNIKFIHTQISSRIEDVNLSAIVRMGKITGKEAAFGLHCNDHHVLYAAMALGPSDIFFYVKERANENTPTINMPCS